MSHDTPPKEIKDAMVPPRGRSASAGPGARGRSASKGKGKGKGKAKAKAAPAQGATQQTQQTPKFNGLTKLWCPFNMKGKCKHGDSCPLPHVDEAAKKSIQLAMANQGNFPLGCHRTHHLDKLFLRTIYQTHPWCKFNPAACGFAPQLSFMHLPKSAVVSEFPAG